MLFLFYLLLFLNNAHAHTHAQLVATSVGVCLVAYHEAHAEHEAGARGGRGWGRGEFEDLLELDDDHKALL